MSKITSIVYVGKSGTQYPFNVYPITEECPNEGGIYVFGKYNQIANTIEPLYIGRAKSFESRFYDHHKDQCVKSNGGNCICLMNIPDESKRTVIEKDLLAAYATKCNEVNNPVTPR